MSLAGKRKAEDITGTTDATAVEILEIGIDEATIQATKALQAVGWNEKNASLQAEIMVYAETHGNTPSSGQR